MDEGVVTMMGGPRLQAVLQAGQQHAARTGARGNTPAAAKKDVAQPKSSDPRNPTTAKPAAAKPAAAKPAAAKPAAAKPAAAKPAAAKPAASKMASGVAWIGNDVEELATKRAKHMAVLAKARREAEQCVKNEDAAEDKYATTSLTEADALIKTLAKELKEKIADYDVLQKRIEDIAKAGESEKGDTAKKLKAAEVALNAERAEKDGEIKRLKGELKACEDNAQAAKKALETKCASDLQDLRAEKAKKLKEDQEMIEGLTAQIKVLTEKNGKCGKAEQSKIEARQKAQRDAVKAYEDLNARVCQMLKDFKPPSSTTEV